jgi:hypothetical protein
MVSFSSAPEMASSKIIGTIVSITYGISLIGFE